MIKKIDHIVITTAQPTVCIAFYKNLGFTARKIGGRYELFAGDFKINVHIKGSEFLPHAEIVMPGSVDLCFEISGSLVAFKEELESKGLTIELGIVERTGVNGNMCSFYLRDADGNLVEFCSYE